MGIIDDDCLDRVSFRRNMYDTQEIKIKAGKTKKETKNETEQ